MGQMTQGDAQAAATQNEAHGSFSGKLAVVTGGGSGMGRELVRQLAAQGCSVAACDWHADAVAQTAAIAQAGAGPGDVCDLEWGTARTVAGNWGRAGADWAVITEFSQPAPDRFVRDITTFVPDGHGAWRRDSEHHENVLVDTSRIPELLHSHGVSASVRSSFGQETLPPGLKTIVGTRR
jgi:short chain dehydrogenase